MKKCHFCDAEPAPAFFKFAVRLPVAARYLSLISILQILQLFETFLVLILWFNQLILT